MKNWLWQHSSQAVAELPVDEPQLETTVPELPAWRDRHVE
jgi:hypothetical protein